MLDEEMVEEKCDRKSHFSSFRLCYKTTTAIENAALRSVVAEFFLSFRFVSFLVVYKHTDESQNKLKIHAMKCSLMRYSVINPK